MTSQTTDPHLRVQRSTVGSCNQFACIGAVVALLFAPLSSAETPVRDASLADGGCGAPIVVAIATSATSASDAKPKAANLAPSRPLPKTMQSPFNASACSISLATWRAFSTDAATQLAGLPMIVDVRSTEARVTRPLSKDANVVAIPMSSVTHAHLTQSRPILLVGESATQVDAVNACIALRERGNANAFVLTAGERAWFAGDELTNATATVSAPGHLSAVIGTQLGRLEGGAAARMLDDEATEVIEGDLPTVSERLARPLPNHKSQRLILFSPASANITQQSVDHRMANAPFTTWWSLATRSDLEAVLAQSRTTALAANAPLLRPCGVQ
jgi:hypothetical protein